LNEDLDVEDGQENNSDRMSQDETPDDGEIRQDENNFETHSQEQLEKIEESQESASNIQLNRVK
jgi:hypothetical protein